MRTSNNYLILSLSLADFLMESKVFLAVYNGYHGGPYLGVGGAKVRLIVNILFIFSSVENRIFIPLLNNGHFNFFFN